MEGEPNGPNLTRGKVLTRTAQLAVVGGAVALSGDQTLKYRARREAVLPEVNSPNFHSPYFDSAEKRVDLLVKDNGQIIKRALTEIDAQGLASLDWFRSNLHPDVQFIHNKIDVNDLYAKLFSNSSVSPATEKTSNRLVYVIFPGFSQPPAGSPFTPWDIVYDRVIGLLYQLGEAKAQGKEPPKIAVIVPGSPNSLWGKVSEQWVTQLEKDKLKPYGDLYAEFLEPYLATGNPASTRVILQGISMGGVVAKLTAESISEKTKRHLRTIQVLADNPIGLGTSKSVVTKAFQIGFGFATEGYIQSNYTARGQSVMAAEKVFYQRARQEFEKKNIEPIEDSEQYELKQRAARQDILNMVRGTNTTNTVRTFARIGLYDPLTFSPKRIRETRKLVQGNRNPVLGIPNGLQFSVATTHFMDRFSDARVKQWETVVKFCKQSAHIA